jgi:hypothetical protein
MRVIEFYIYTYIYMNEGRTPETSRPGLFSLACLYIFAITRTLRHLSLRKAQNELLLES